MCSIKLHPRYPEPSWSVSREYLGCLHLFLCAVTSIMQVSFSPLCFFDFLHFCTSDAWLFGGLSDLQAIVLVPILITPCLSGTMRKIPIAQLSRRCGKRLTSKYPSSSHHVVWSRAFPQSPCIFSQRLFYG